MTAKRLQVEHKKEAKDSLSAFMRHPDLPKKVGSFLTVQDMPSIAAVSRICRSGGLAKWIDSLAVAKVKDEWQLDELPSSAARLLLKTMTEVLQASKTVYLDDEGSRVMWFGTIKISKDQMFPWGDSPHVFAELEKPEDHTMFRDIEQAASPAFPEFRFSRNQREEVKVKPCFAPGGVLNHSSRFICIRRALSTTRTAPVLTKWIRLAATFNCPLTGMQRSTWWDSTQCPFVPDNASSFACIWSMQTVTTPIDLNK
jgi:hypothetical protein